jgi:outer membrane protein
MQKLVLAGIALFALTPVLSAETNPWSVRLRATYVNPVDHSDAAGPIPANGISVSDKLIPEFDIDYTITSRWSCELVLTVPQEHSVKVTKGALAGTKLGNFSELPPTFLLQYHPDCGKKFRPYLGAGVNCTLIFHDNLAAGATKLNLDNYSVGPAAQAGFDYVLSDRWAINVDIKRMVLRSDVSLVGGAKFTQVQLDPWLYSLGLAYRF